VPAGGEVYKCQNFQNTIGSDVAIVESDSFMSPGSHHMFVFHDPSFDTDTGTMADCSGTEFHDFLHSAQTPQQTVTYPATVGRKLASTEGLRILAHYLNSTSADLTAQVDVKFHYVPTSGVKYLASELFLNQALINVPTGMSTQSATYNTPWQANLLLSVSHMHKRGTNFLATTSTGVTLYQGKTWDEPQTNNYDPPLAIPSGTTITWACSYDNETGQALTFGESAATNEMCIFVGTYYSSDMAHQGVPMNSVIGIGGL
jgi:hypothetical protein